MANTDRPNGFRPVRMLSGAPWNGQVEEYNVDSSNTPAIFVGDAVVMEADGNLGAATTSSVIYGVCVGVKVNRDVAATEHPGYLPVSTQGTIQIVIGRDVVFEVQEDSAGNDITAAMVGANGPLVATAGSTTTGRSAMELDSSVVSTNNGSAATDQFRIIRLVSRVDNALGTNAKWEVVINEHQLADSTAGV